MFEDIRDFDIYTLNNEKLEYHKKYFKMYFNDTFKYGQGTEIILDVLNKFSYGGDWLDLGSGVSTFFWSLAIDGLKSISCSDYDIEALKLLFDFSNSTEIPKCYYEVMNIYNREESFLLKNKDIVSNYYLFDALKSWPSIMQNKKYNLITEFGLFGLCKTQSEFINCFNYIKPSLHPNSIVIGANWVLSKSYSYKRQHYNNYINKELIFEASRKHGYNILFCSYEEIKNDPDYDYVLIWAVENNQ